MATLTELTTKNHKSFKISPRAHIKYAAKQHVINLNAIEIAHGATCFPIFITRNTQNGAWAVSAMTSFEIEQNLFVEKGIWQSIFQPSNLRTYPLYLMKVANGEKAYTIGFDAASDALNEIEGIPLFDDNGKATQHLSEITKMLENQITDMQQTYEFGKTLEQLGLLRAIDLHVIYQDGTVNVIKGLHTINEDVLNSLEADKLEKLHKLGYLSPIYAMLISLFQLNSLLTKNNLIDGKPKVSNVKMEVAKDDTLI
ncbi:SapC family protein [Glaciecola petra]|uniref:SapC family protein n=1 Tax=Glaciecola petra TaxID=3075602 RepID=A0ABU2ZWX0_9ALTE|nr:SapC family protein [Aestuariibacter sp. P117]MDT0596074.1 SapC family protein [Aestuariibacter sp. P117]